MGLLKKFKGRPITGATRPQNRPANIRQGEGGLAAQSQLSGPPAPFQNAKGSANLRTGTNQSATVGVGDGRSRNAANIRGAQPMSDSQVMRGAGYKKKPNYRGYAVHQPAKQGGARPLYKRETNEELFGPGYEDYKKLHGSI
jgi:hypothetical protein